MRMRPGTGGIALVVAVVALGAVWATAPDRVTVVDHGPVSVGAIERGPAGRLAAAELPDVAIESALSVAWPIQPRLGPLWALPGLAAALAAICLFRRLRATPPPTTRQVLLLGSRSGRAPPVGSFA